MDGRFKIFCVVLLVLFLAACAYGVKTNMASAEPENSITLVGEPPGTQNVKIFMFRQPAGAVVYTCFVVVGSVGVDISCP